MADVPGEMDRLFDQYKKMFGEAPAFCMLPTDSQEVLAILKRAVETKTPIQYPDVPDNVQY